MKKIIVSLAMWLAASLLLSAWAQTQIDLPVSFDAAGVNYTLTDFGDNSTVLGNDPAGGTNQVAITTKPATAATWAGTTIGTPIGFANPIPFTSTNNSISVRVYSPAAGLVVMLKPEHLTNGGIFIEVQQTTTVANAWETLTFNFSSGNLTQVYHKLSIFFNFNATGTAYTFSWDDVMMVGGATGPAQINLPVTFDDANVDYTLTDFGDNVSALELDPAGGTNMVAKSTKPATAQTWAGTTVGTPAGFASPIPFTAANMKLSMRVYSPAIGLPIMMKAENGPTNKEVTQNTTVANAWETLEYDFTGIDMAVAYSKLSIFFNFNATGTAYTFYWDDVMMVMPAAPAQINLPVTFDEANVDYTLTDFGDNVSALELDPAGGTNMVAKSTKPATAATWAGTTIGTPAGFASPVPFTASDTKVSMRVYSPAAGLPIMLKAENGPTNKEVTRTSTVANAWETLEFDFAGIDMAIMYYKLSVFFNFNATGTAYSFYWDDVMMVETVGPVKSQIDLPVTFEDTTVNYTVTDFGDASTMLVADPTGGTNTVAKTVKPVTAPTWAGTTACTPAGMKTEIPFTATNRKMTLRVYAPAAGMPVLLKAEVPGVPTQSVETLASTTKAGEWETLTFDFDVQRPGTAAFNAAFPYRMVSVFFNFDVSGATAGEKTFYWDDMMMDGTNGVEALVAPFTHAYLSESRTLRLTSEALIQEVRMYSLAGQQVAVATKGNTQQTLSLETLANGLYVVKVLVDNQPYAFKVVVE